MRENGKSHENVIWSVIEKQKKRELGRIITTVQVTASQLTESSWKSASLGNLRFDDGNVNDNATNQ